jgi:hypothetical protein
MYLVLSAFTALAFKNADFSSHIEHLRVAYDSDSENNYLP